MTLSGIVHGKSIELEQESGLPDGQQVKVILVPSSATSWTEPNEGLLRAFGSWSDDPEGVDKFVEETYRLRKIERPDLTE